jgi:uncharacterized protein YdcH (DUF465 family)
MHVDHHPLAQDFPELRDTLHALRAQDHHFARLCNEYEELDKRICRIEDDIEPTGDEVLTHLKQERVTRKDELYRLMKNSHEPTCCGGCGK